MECGYVQLPKIKVMDRRIMNTGESEVEGDDVKVVDVRWDRRAAGENEEVIDARRSIESSGGNTGVSGATTILVLP